jgi:NADH dehydrogenase/NADH:ubiquinone oxidoreductase subunit G
MDVNLFGNYQNLLRVEVLGRQLEVPEHNTLLRGFQFAAPQTISYGRFCWNGSCNNCTVTVRDGSCESKGQACTMDARDGMHVTAVSGEIRRLL